MASPVDLSTILQVHQCWTHLCTKMTVQDWDSTEGKKNLNFLKNLDVTHNLTFSILLSSVFKRATRAIFVFSLNYSLEVFDTVSARFVLKILSKILFFVSFMVFTVFVFRNFPQNFDLLIWYLII
mgnify:CR=1 FL=1